MSPSKILTLNQPDGPTPFVPARQYYRIKQDDEIIGYERPAEGAGFNPPMVFRLEPHHYVKMDRPYQEMWFGMNRSNDWDEDYKDWLAYTKGNVAFTNNTGIFDRFGYQVARDYIGNTGVEFKDPMQATLVCGRNVLCGTEVTLGYKLDRYPAGTPMLKVETIREPSMKYTRNTHPHLVHVATVITYVKWTNGLYKVNAFPMRGGRAGFAVYYPVSSLVDMYYPMSRLEKLPLGAQVPPPYNPP